MVMTEEMDCGRPVLVSAQLPLRAASKNGEAKKRTSLCALCQCVRRARDSSGEDRPERCALHNNLDVAGQLTVLRERLVELDSLLGLVDAQLRHDLVRLAFLQEPWWRA